MSDQFRPIFDDDDVALPQERDGSEREVDEQDIPKLMPSEDGWDERLDKVSMVRVLSLVAGVVAILTGAVVGVRAAINASTAETPRARAVQRPVQRSEPPPSLRGLGDALARDEAVRNAASRPEDPYAAVDPSVGATTAVAPLEFDGPVPRASKDDDDVVTDEEMARYEAEHRASQQRASTSTATAQPNQRGQQAAAPGLPPMEVWGTDWSPSGQPRATLPVQPVVPVTSLSGGAVLSGSRPEVSGGRLETPDDVKEAFAARTGNLDSQAIERELGECELTAGDAISVGNVDAVNTDIPAKAAILVEVVQDVYCGADHQHIAIPAGSRFTASANARVSYGDALIQLCMDQLKRPPSKGFPNGSLVPITGCWAAAELDGTIGWTAQVDNHWDKVVGAITLSTLLSLGSSAATGNQTGFAPTLAQRAAANAGQQFNQAGNRIVMRELGVKPTLTREMLQTARVKVTTNTALQPWLPRRRRR